MSYIELSRRELVWETRRYRFTENDWQHFIQQQQDLLKYSDITRFNAQQVLEAVKDLTFRDIVADFDRCQNHGDESIMVTQRFRYGRGERRIPLADLILDALRDHCYDAELSEVDYANDFDEDFVCEVDERQV